MMVRLVILWFFVPLLICLSSTNCIKSFPKHLHCLAHLSFDSEARGVIDFLRVEEYLDIEARKSSISVYNHLTGFTEILYNHNEVSTQDFGRRKMVLFTPSRMSCRPIQFSDWQFGELRRVAIYLYDTVDMDELYVDVPTGPSVLLYAVQANPEQFKFAKKIQSKSLLTNVNVFTREMGYNPRNSIFRRLKLVIHVLAVSQRPGLNVGDSLKSASLEDSRLRIQFFGACQLQGRKSKAAQAEEGWDQDDFCLHKSGEKLLFLVEYNIIELHKPDLLVGDQLAEHENSYDFTREPHAQPVGIGCWGQSTDRSLRGILSGHAGSGQASVSAAYVVSNGLRGVSFVAYDGTRHLLRLDREGRKSVYDCTGGKSYHAAEFGSSDGKSSLLAEELALEKCIVLDMDDKSSYVSPGGDILDQLFGLGLVAHYLGSRAIGGVAHEIYELEVASATHVPLVLRAKLSKPIKHDSVFYITYYVEAPNSPRYIELYASEPVSKKRRLINRLEFVEFSWSLEVEPSNDSESPASSLRLFELESCIQKRAAQASMTVSFERATEKGQVGAAQLAGTLADNKPLLTGSIQKHFADVLQISSMNIVGLELRVSKNTSELITTNTIVDLRSGLSQLVLLGGMNYYDYTSHDYILHFYNMRHSLEECQLDSIYFESPNWLAFCPKLAACVLLAPDKSLALKKESGEAGESKSSTEESAPDSCRVYSFKYATVDRSNQRFAAVDRADSNQQSLDGSQFQFEVKSHKDRETGEVQWGYLYRAKIRVVSYKRLESVGLASDPALLSGLRFSTMEEEPLAFNSNRRISLFQFAGKKSDAKAEFTHCRLSCQLDEFCGSFSVCLSLKKSSFDCVLSTLRLTNARVSELVDGARQLKQEDTKYQVNFTSHHSSQAFVIYKDDACGMHPRDFAADYKVTRTFARIPAERPDSDQLDKSAKRHLLGHQPMTLDQCASLSFERTFGCEFVHESNFTYCPMDALCTVRGDAHDELLELVKEGLCLRYQRNPAGAFTDIRSTHMEVLSRRAENEAVEGAQNELADESNSGMVRTFWGLSEDDCARECSLTRSDCLAFDSCRSMGKTLCLLHSVRSPLSPRGAYQPLLKREERILQQTNVRLMSSLICDHFHLKPAYFDVRLKDLLARQEGRASKLPVDLDELERKIENNNEQSSKRELVLLEEDEQKSHANLHHKERLIHWFELVFGLVIGCFLVSFKREMKGAALVFFERLSCLTGRPDEQRLVTDRPDEGL